MSEFMPLLDKILNQPFGWIGVTLVILLYGIHKLADKTTFRVEIIHKFDYKEEDLAKFLNAITKASVAKAQESLIKLREERKAM